MLVQKKNTALDKFSAGMLMTPYYKGGIEERDRRLPKAVKLLTALNYRVGSYFIFMCFSISFKIAFAVERCVSAQRPGIVAGWV